MSPLHVSTAEAALYQPQATERMLKTSAAAPISLTQAGAFHAANKKPLLFGFPQASEVFDRLFRYFC